MKHCGHAKGNDYDKALLISPLDKNCEKRFAYSVNGKIEPSDLSDQGAEYTIKLLAAITAQILLFMKQSFL